MSEFDSTPNHQLNDEQRVLLDNFCEGVSPKSLQEQSMVDQAASELRDTLQNMGLVIETEEQFFTACVITIATAVNMRKLAEQRLPIDVAQSVAEKSIAALRPDSSR